MQPKTEQAKEQANAAGVPWEVEAWALLTNPMKAIDAATLSAHLADLG